MLRSVAFFTAACLSAGAYADLPKRAIVDISSPDVLFRRQNNENSTCYAFGIDFVDGGSYFINSLSNVNFTAVSQFQGCNDDLASILLVNDETEDEYECTSVPTVPDNTPELSTCPILKSQMTTGNWSILAIGNNGNGNPFAWQRDFFLTVGPQQTVTITPTVTYSQTITPTITITSTSTIESTTTISNNLTVTVPAATQYTTITPPAVTDTTTSYITKTIRRWTKTQTKITEVITATCTVPPRPWFPDPYLHFVPTAIPLPLGLHIDLKRRADKPADYEYVRKRFERHRNSKARAAQEEAEEIARRAIAARSADAPTVTSTAKTAVNVTSTITAPTSTLADVTITTDTIRTTLPPVTIKSGSEVDTITAPTPTTELTVIGYTTTYVTKTLSLTWTYTTTTTPAASATACKSRGGHFGNGWGNGW